MTTEEYLAIETAAKYKFYKDYVEDLEKAHDKLLDEVIRLRDQNVKLYKKNKTMSNLLKQYRGY